MPRQQAVPIFAPFTESPDRDCDMGPQVARWAPLPHAGLQSMCGGKEITQAAARFNTALQQVAVETQQALSAKPSKACATYQ